MNLCSDGHEEICYEGRKCPACELLEQIDALEGEISELNSEMQSLKETL